MSAKKKLKKLDELFPEKSTNHGNGKCCDECGKRKETKKVGKRFLCPSCRRELQ